MCPCTAWDKFNLCMQGNQSHTNALRKAILKLIVGGMSVNHYPRNHTIIYKLLFFFFLFHLFCYIVAVYYKVSPLFICYQQG